MPHKQKFLLVLIFGVLGTLISFDLVDDFQEGVPWWHLAFEALVILTALLGMVVVLKGAFHLQRHLELERKLSFKHQGEATQWRAKAEVFLTGLSQAIDKQLSIWELSKSEKEVAFLLLKGYSLKEIAGIRGTSEKTARTQSAAIYVKAGLNSRSQLSAFFLEDLLIPESRDSENEP